MTRFELLSHDAGAARSCSPRDDPGPICRLPPSRCRLASNATRIDTVTISDAPLASDGISLHCCQRTAGHADNSGTGAGWSVNLADHAQPFMQPQVEAYLLRYTRAIRLQTSTFTRDSGARIYAACSRPFSCSFDDSISAKTLHQHMSVRRGYNGSMRVDPCLSYSIRCGSSPVPRPADDVLVEEEQYGFPSPALSLNRMSAQLRLGSMVCLIQVCHATECPGLNR